MDARKLKQRKKRLGELDRELKKLFPHAAIALRYKTPWELLVAVILSAQCTDKRVNIVTEKLFQKYRTLNEYVNANPREFEKDIHSCGFYRNKTKSILGAAKIVQRNFKGKIPQTMTEMLTIPGVARKTGNVVLGNAHGIVEGIAVDTHVRRFAIRFDLSDHRDPVRIERDLMQLLPKKDWLTFTYRVIEYGRDICPARRHECKNHPLTKLHPSAANIWPKAK